MGEAFWCERKGLIGVRRRVFSSRWIDMRLPFVTTFFVHSFGWREWEGKGNSMGLILDARGHFFLYL